MKVQRLAMVLMLAIFLPSCGNDSPSTPTPPPTTGPTAPAGVNLSVTAVNANTTTNNSNPPFPVIEWEICLQYDLTLDPLPAAGIDIAPLETRGLRPNGNTVILDVVDPPALPPGGIFSLVQCSEFTQNANIGDNGVVNQIQVDATGTDDLGNPFTDQQLFDFFANDLENLNQMDCVPGNTTLCLGDGGRFKVQMDFNDGNNSGPATVNFPGFGVDNDIGSFFFINPNNEDLIIQLLNNCNTNNHFWVFYGATTNVEFELIVTDTVAGQTRTYDNPLGQPAPPIQDTQAFATCPSPVPLPVP